jgi:hypothetical protein
LDNQFVLEVETVRIFKMSAVQPVTWNYHPEAGATLELNFHKSLKYSVIGMSLEQIKLKNFFQPAVLQMWFL